jgi:hypothetical protein
MLEQGFGLLQPKAFGDVSIVLDASESACEYQEAILQAAVQLFEKLPAGIAKGLYFLSNPKRYDVSKLPRNAVKWWEQNRLRGSFLTSILEQVENSKVVVIGSGPIYDLEDWQESRWASKLYFIKVGESLRGGLEIGEEIEDSSQALSCLHDPVISVEITGTGFMPYYWSNPKYKLSIGDRVTLQGSNLENLSVFVGFFGSDVKAYIVKRSGEECTLLKSAEDKEQVAWSTLSDEECEIFYKAINGEEFTCLVCRRNHLPSGLKCDRSSILGEPVYPTLGKRRGFVFFKETPDGILFRFHPASAARIGNTTVAVALGGRAKIYEYNLAEEQWGEKGYLKPYHALEDGYIAVI